jgi:hypothetical protein
LDGLDVVFVLGRQLIHSLVGGRMFFTRLPIT